jgi:hypothetical protein
VAQVRDELLRILKGRLGVKVMTPKDIQDEIMEAVAPFGPRTIQDFWKERSKMLHAGSYGMEPAFSEYSDEAWMWQRIKVKCPGCGREFAALGSPYTVRRSHRSGLDMTDSWSVNEVYQAHCVECGTDFTFGAHLYC